MANANTRSKQPFRVYRNMHLMGNSTYDVETLGAARTILETDPHFLKFDCGGAGRDCTLRAEEKSQGMWHVIMNASDAAETLTVKDDAGSTIIAILQDRAAIVVCDGTTWIHMGLITIALS